jgi:predicted extracellular nuclease
MINFKKAHLLSALLILVFFTALIPAAAPANANPSELFFSEYIEGSSYNKALEIYNGTGAEVDLAAGSYRVEVYFNGSDSPGLVIALEGTVADGDVYVVTNQSADPEILAQADLVTTSTGWFNGDDAVVLFKGSAVLDVIGQVGFDPGSEWGSGLTSTSDNTLVRHAGVCAGDANGDDAFDPAVEWAGYDQNTFSNLGAHTASCLDAAEPVINEFVFNHTGSDTHEFVEVYGEASSDYAAYTLLELEGDGTGAGYIDGVFTVGTTDAAGFWVTGFFGNEFENGTVTLLLVKDFTGSLGVDLDSDNDGSLDSEPWSAVVDGVAVFDGGSTDQTYAAAVLAGGFDGVSFTPGGASRIPDGTGVWVRNDFDGEGLPGFSGSIADGEAYNTPGESNQEYVPPPEACGDPYTPIYTLQGSGFASDYDGMEVATEGIVVGDFQDYGQKGGFFLQDPAGDGDAATSDGIFVYHYSTPVSVGDHVRVRGTVDEYFNLTEVTSVSLVLTCSTGHSLAATPLSLPVSDLADFEPFEGMLVTFPQDLSISEYYNFDRYGEIVLTAGRQFQPTALYEPGSPEAAQLAQENLLGRITLDDGRTSENPDPALHPNGMEFTLDNRFRGGDLVTDLTGALDYGFGLWRVQPTQGAGYTPDNLRTLEPESTGGSLKVAAFNVLNYFTTLGSRGADNAEEFTRQRDKIFAALAAIDADVVGLIEIENNGTAVADLVDGLNALVGAGTYAYVDTGVLGTDEIIQAFIYKPATVSLVGAHAVLDDPAFTDPLGYGEQKSRPALAQTFMDSTTGGVFTAVINHFKSKGTPCGPGDDDPETGSCNLTRTLGAQALLDWLAGDPTVSGDQDFLILGDLNAYDKEDPIDVLLAGGYTDLVSAFQGEHAYSYVFDGQLGYLDYAVGSPDLMDEIAGTTVWHINADEPDLIDYDTSYKQDPQDEIYAADAYRSSDHDPVITGLAVCDEIPPTLEVSVSPDTLWPVNHKYVDVVATVLVSDNFDPNPSVSLVSVTSNQPDDDLGDGRTANDIVIVDGFSFMLRAERSGVEGERVYTITYLATDACGNTTQATATVRVPHDKGE